MLFEERLGGEERRLMHLVPALLWLTGEPQKHTKQDWNLDPTYVLALIKKERCSGSFHLAVGFLVIKDDSISERPG